MLSMAKGGEQPHDDAAPQENRSAPRRAASAVPAITGLRISPHGVEAALVNISESGLLAECGERIKPGSAVTVVFEGTFDLRSMEGRVARNSVSSMGKDGRLRYHVGIAFARPIVLGPLDEPAAEPAITPEPAPVPPPASTSSGATSTRFEPASLAASIADSTPAGEQQTIEFDVPLPAAEPIRNRW